MTRSNHRTARRAGAARASLAAAAVLLLASAPVRAQLVAPFSNTIDVDPMYASGTNLTDIAWAGDGRAVIVRKDGGVVIRQTSGTTVVRTGLFGTVDTGSEKGLLGVVAHPDVATNNTFFFYVSNGTSNDDKHRVLRGVLDAGNQFMIDMSNPVVSASVAGGPGLRGPANHDGGGLFIHNRQLYIGVGDTGSNATPPTNKFSSCLNLGNGKILRVNLDGTVPTDNPLVNQAMGTACTSPTGAWSTAAPDRRVYAWGLRNPWRIWVDRQTNLLWIGDVGETTREEISVGSIGNHFGYPFREGTEQYLGANGRAADGSLQNMHCSTMTPSRTCTGPVHDYDSGGSAGNSVIGGLIPEGCGWSTALGGTLYYLFADHGGGWIHALTVRPDRMGVMSSTATNFGSFSGSQPRSMRMGPDESLYVVMSASVYRFTPRDRTGCGMGGMGGAGGMAGGGGRGGAGAGGASAGTGNTAGASMGGVGMGGAGNTAGVGMGGVGMGGAGSGGDAGPGGTGVGGATAGSGVTGGAAGTGTTTGGAAPTGGVGANGGAPTGGVPGAGVGAAPVAGSGDGASDDEGGCGCRVGRSDGVGYLALALGLFFAVGARLRRRRKGA